MKSEFFALIIAVMGCLSLPAKTVDVSGYYRMDGTYVRSHTRQLKDYSVPSSQGCSVPSSFLSAGDVGPSQASRSLETCQAIYACGTRCTRYVALGGRYCDQHHDYDPNRKPVLKVVKLPKTAEERIAATRLKLEKVRKCVDYYSDRRGGELPPDLSMLKAGNPTFMAPPTKDAWGREFAFCSEEDGLLVRSAGMDGEFGNDDDIVMIMEK